MKFSSVLATSTVLAGLLLAPTAHADTFINGGFESGDATGWTIGEGFRGGITNSNLSPATIAPPGTSLGHSSIIAAGTIDPRQGASLGTTVYQGNFSWRAEDTNTGGFASYIQQTVLNYTDPDIFFEWKAVLLGAHGPEDSATMKIILTDLTTGTDVIVRNNNAAGGGGGVDPSVFTYDPSTNNFYTPNWQVEHLDVAGLGLTGHDFLLTVIGADCSPTAHWGYVYLDGFAGIIVPPSVPEPASLALLSAGVLGLAAARRKRR